MVFLSFFLLSPISHIGLRQMVLFDRVLCSQIGLLFTIAKVSSLVFTVIPNVSYLLLHLVPIFLIFLRYSKSDFSTKKTEFIKKNGIKSRLKSSNEKFVCLRCNFQLKTALNRGSFVCILVPLFVLRFQHRVLLFRFEVEIRDGDNVCLFVRLFVCSFVCLFARLFICSSVCPCFPEFLSPLHYR